MITLSEREHLVAEQYCKGLADKEVADSLQRSEWTIKAQKRDIYKKLGISKQTISSYESNVKKPSILTARKLARALNCSLDYLLGLENSETIAIQDLRPGERELILQYIRVFHTDKEPPR